MQKLVLLLCLFPITAFGQWESHIAPGDEDIFELVVANDVIIASSKAGIFRSTNQGDSWEFCMEIGNYK